MRHFNASRYDEFWELIDPDCVLATDPGWPGGGRYEGKEGCRRFVDQFLEAFGGIRLEQVGPTEAIGRCALLRARWVGSGLTSGIEASSDEFSIVMLADSGQIREMHFWFSERQARQTAAALA